MWSEYNYLTHIGFDSQWHWYNVVVLCLISKDS